MTNISDEELEKKTIEVLGKESIGVKDKNGIL